jgi:hypothetical protein
MYFGDSSSCAEATRSFAHPSFFRRYESRTTKSPELTFSALVGYDGTHTCASSGRFEQKNGCVLLAFAFQCL